MILEAQRTIDKIDQNQRRDDDIDMVLEIERNG